MPYFQQRFQNYSDNFLGSSPYQIKVAGCTTCAIYTLNSILGGSETPLTNNQDLKYDTGGNILWQSVNLSKIKFNYRYYAFNREQIRNDVLNPKRCVILNIKVDGVIGGKHWLAVLSLGDGQYNCYDPWSNTKRAIKIDQVLGSAHFDIK